MNPPTHLTSRARKAYSTVLSKHNWTSIGVFSVLVIVALFFVLSGAGQTRVSVFGSVELDKPVLASSNDRGTVIVDSAKTRLVFADPNNELRRIVQVDGGELPVTEVSHVRLADEGVIVVGSRHSDDGETIASESVLCFDYDGTYLYSLWSADYAQDDGGSDKSAGASDEDEGKGSARKTYFEPTVMDAQAERDASSTLKGIFLARTTGYASAGIDVEIDRVGINNDDFREASVAGGPSSQAAYALQEFVRDARYLPDSGRCVVLGDWGSIYVEDMSSSTDTSTRPGNTGGYALHTASDRERYALIDALGDSAVAYDCIGSRIVRFDGLSGEHPTTSVLAENVEVESVTLSLDGSRATVVLNNDEIRKYDSASGSFETMTKIYPGLSLRVHTFLLSVSWLYLIIGGLAIVIGTLRRKLREGRHDELYRAISSLATAAILVGFLLNNFFMNYQEDVRVTSAQLTHAAAIVGYSSPKMIGDVVKREVSVIEKGGEDVALEEYIVVKHFLEEFSASSFNNGVGIQSAIFGVSSDGAHVWNLGDTQRSLVTGNEVTDGELRDNVLKAAQNASGYASYADVEEIMVAISEDNPLHEASRDSREGYLFTCYVPIIASDGSCSAVLEVSKHFGSFWSQQTGKLFESILALALITIAIYYASNELVKSAHALRHYHELRDKGVWWAGAALSRPLNFLCTLATGIDSALAIVLARDMLTSQGMDSNALMWGLPALAITVGGLLGTLVQGHYAGLKPARSFSLNMMRVGIVAQCVCAVAMANSSFWLFVAGKLFAGIGYDATRRMVDTLARQAKGKEKFDAVVGLYAKMPAGILAGVLGGVLSSIGSTWLYVVGALVGTALFLLLREAMPEDRPVSELGQALDERKLLNFVFSKKMLLTAVFAMVPVTLVGGYRKFIFPLLLDSSGMTKQQIANIFVIADVVLYIAHARMRAFRETHDKWRMTWISLVLLGLTFMLFSLNQSPTLAILVVVVASVIVFFANSHLTVCRSWALTDYGYERVRADTALESEKAAIKNVQAPVLSSLQLLGGPVSCVILGIFYAICGLLYRATTRRYRPGAQKQTPAQKK